LLKLAEHLENGKLGHKKFHFNRWNVSKDFGGTPYKCGYMGCAIGECPVLFPRQWKFDWLGYPVLRTTSDPKTDCERAEYFVMPTSEAAAFFGLEDRGEVEALFLPEKYRPWAPKKELQDSTTKKQVAKSIRKFVEWRESGKYKGGDGTEGL
jgi:hypothetical protein